MCIRVRDVMATKVQTVRPKTMITDLERSLLAHHMSGFPVVENERLVGVVSRSDVVRALSVQHTYEEQLADHRAEVSGGRPIDAAASAREIGARVGMRIEGLRVEDIMVRDVRTASPDETLEEVARVLVNNCIHRLPVTDEEKLVGIITSLDLVRLIAEGRFSVA